MKNNQHTRKVFALIILLALQVYLAKAQMVWPAGPMMVNIKVNAAGDLEIRPSATSSAHDFDYLAGKWTMDNKRLKSRLNGCTEWISYPSTDENSGPVLNGIANTDIFKTSFNQFGDSPYQGMTVRLFNTQTKLWSLYWVDSNTGAMDPPVVGSFEGNVGRFYCKDVFKGKPIIMMFVWDKTDQDNPIWYQAFSPDNGVTWEWNMTNVSHRVK